MQTKEIKILVTEYESIEELITIDRELVLSARAIAEKAYAPYSKFRVGAAVLMDDGSIICGNNQENASSPVGICAERTALFWANANYPDKAVKAIAITAIDSNRERAINLSPCGLCRQAMLETQHRYASPIRVILDSRKRIEIIQDAEGLLPLSFNGNALKHGV